MLDFWLGVGPVLLFLALGYGVGRYRERLHFVRLRAREAELADMAVRVSGRNSGDDVIAV